MRIAKFAFVGGIGFVADTIVLFIMIKLFGFPVMAARAIAFVVAATVTWFGNRNLTFSDQTKQPKLRQWLKFMSGAIFSAIPNFLAFKLCLLLTETTSDLWIFVSLAMGVLVGMVSNFLLSKFWVFRSKEVISNH